MPNISIDNVTVFTEEGKTVLEAALRAGIWIPTLCWYPKITPSDSCRLCVVEIDGLTRPVTSCNTVAVDGMVVRTDTPRVQTMREEVMKLILMDHPLVCPECPAGGECEIQDLTHRLGISGTDFPIAVRSDPVVTDWPLIQYDANLCITCLRCVKVCHEVIGASALRLRGTGYGAHIDTVDGRPLCCDFCGECVEACPSGAMSLKAPRQWARSWQLRKIPTVCPLCSAGCRMEVNVKDNRIFRITSDLETHNRGSLCVGGRFGFDLVHSEERLTRPLLRKNGIFEPVSWDEALDFTATELSRILDRHGADAVAGLASPRLANEDCYAFQKFFRGVLGSNSIDSEARFSYLRIQRAMEFTGCARAGAGLEELPATGTILVVGTDPLEETPALGWKIKTATRRHDVNLIVANSRSTSLDPFARIRLRIRPYAESDLALGLMKIVFDNDLWDRSFVESSVSHFLPMKNLLDKVALSGILRRTGLTEQELQRAARMFAEAPSAAIIFGGDVILQEQGLQCVMNLADLALLTGNMGRPNAGLYPIHEKGNIVGLCEMGVMPEFLPGYQDFARARPVFEKVWKRDLPYARGHTALEIPRGIQSGEIRAVYCAGADPLTDYPYSAGFAEALKNSELLVVQDLFLSPTAARAHCVFPAASWAEKTATLVNFERRLQSLNQALEPLGESRPDWSILEAVATAMGTSMGYSDVDDVFRDMALTVPSFRGLRMKDLTGDGVMLASPVMERGDRLRDGKPYAFAPAGTREKPVREDVETYPFELIAGRSMTHFGSVTTRSADLRELSSTGFVEIHPADAERLGIATGDAVCVESELGSITGPAMISSRVSIGMVFAPTSFPDFPVYSLFRENTTVCRVAVTGIDESENS